MSIKTLLEQLDGRNIAEDIDEEKLMNIGLEVKRRFDEDMSSMTDWANIIDEGMKLLEQDFRPKSEPFDGASNYKSPVIPEGVIKFGDRAKMELLNSRDLVKADVIGKDPQGQKEARSERVCEFMNYQLNHEMTEWRADQEALFYRVGLIGNLFKKTQFDPFKGRNVSKTIHYPNFAVNQSTTTIDECRSFTDILAFSRNDVFERQNSGTWLDDPIYPELDSGDSKGDEGSNESNDVDNAEENEDRFLEQHCYEDLDGDGYAEPYIITVHEKSKKVVRIDPCYTENSIRVRVNNRILTVIEAINQQAKEFIEEAQTGVQTALVEGFEPDHTKMKLISIQQESQITSYPFYPSLNGQFLGFGYFHIVANLAKSNNVVTNLLLDAGQLSNLGGGFLAKGFRKKMGPIRLKPGQYMATEVDPQHLANGIMPNPTREPSQTLFALNDKLESQFRNFMLVASDEKSGIMANTAPTTALAMISEAAIPTSALLLRMTESEAQEFKKLFKLNQRYTEAEDYQMVLDDKKADYEADFESKLMDIAPVANPEMSSKMQKAQMAEAQMAVFDRVLQSGGNPIPIVKNYLELIGSELIDRVFPEEGAMTEQEKQQMAAMTAAQEQANKMQEVQISLLNQQVKNEGLEAQSLAVKRDAEVGQIKAKVEETMANTILLFEKAESEQVKNGIDIYTSRMQSIMSMLDRAQNNATTANNLSSMPTEELMRIAQGGQSPAISNQ